MPLSIPAPSRHIQIEPLTASSFAPFGTVVENPVRSAAQNDPRQPSLAAPDVVSANQGTALKYLDVTHMTNFYDLAPSGKPAKAVMNMFVCSPRKLRNANGDQVFDVSILERHPFTSQTFVPMGLSQSDPSTQYLVIVAPTLPTASGQGANRPAPYPTPEPRRRRSIRDIFSRARPSPFTNEVSAPSSGSSKATDTHGPKGAGLPDLSNIRAFIAKGHQAVTYGAGTWHAPMCVLGTDDIDFVVVQFANSVGLEDCQEVELKASERSEGVSVLLGDGAVMEVPFKSKL
ncbi:uncharacterized protein K452DRAFT_285024 [Aplosporella prunicola CBS 121167]|uniref:Ureidoglycolate hydrolase n=1 Tax=Aplosporella prunicola CBS 121167 TaxID=1176127 RepID=A0A6A6BPE5_9PEZI|nr:uncharacterized protein K452DRAFT_285024 [Aplosporella prunicola CBS 121167]KAF2144707.1 hypothetical protein K452DRAFT_285024 [Aplosporella prunicola CBS 121167]